MGLEHITIEIEYGDGDCSMEKDYQGSGDDYDQHFGMKFSAVGDIDLIRIHDFSEEVAERLAKYHKALVPLKQAQAQIRESGRKALIGKRPMTRVGRAFEKSETQVS